MDNYEYSPQELKIIADIMELSDRESKQKAAY